MITERRAAALFVMGCALMLCAGATRAEDVIYIPAGFPAVCAQSLTMGRSYCPDGVSQEATAFCSDSLPNLKRWVSQKGLPFCGAQGSGATGFDQVLLVDDRSLQSSLSRMLEPVTRDGRVFEKSGPFRDEDGIIRSVWVIGEGAGSVSDGGRRTGGNESTGSTSGSQSKQVAAAHPNLPAGRGLFYQIRDRVRAQQTSGADLVAAGVRWITVPIVNQDAEIFRMFSDMVADFRATGGNNVKVFVWKGEPDRPGRQPAAPGAANPLPDQVLEWVRQYETAARILGANGIILDPEGAQWFQGDAGIATAEVLMRELRIAADSHGWSIGVTSLPAFVQDNPGEIRGRILDVLATADFGMPQFYNRFQDPHAGFAAQTRSYFARWQRRFGLVIPLAGAYKCDKIVTAGGTDEVANCQAKTSTEFNQLANELIGMLPADERAIGWWSHYFIRSGNLWDEMRDLPFDDDAAGGIQKGGTGEGSASKRDNGSASSSKSIQYLYHGMYLDEDLQVIENPSEAKLAEYFEGKLSPPLSYADTLSKQSDEATAKGDDQRGRMPPSRLNLTPYGRRCESEGVPMPPALDSTAWVSLGNLPGNQIFALAQFPDVEMLMYRKESKSANELEGICLALPRSNRNGQVQALGVICQGKQSGKACFWDNVDNTPPPAPPNQPEPKIVADRYTEMDINLFQDGYRLREKCTDCHRGSNAYVIFFETPMQPGNTRLSSVLDVEERELARAGRFVPIGQPNWVNPPPGAALDAYLRGDSGNDPSSCATGECHGSGKKLLAALNADYCEIVMRPALHGAAGNGLVYTMPPSYEDRSDFRNTIAYITRECDALIDAARQANAAP